MSDDEYPEAWKSPRIRDMEREAGREERERRQFIETLTAKSALIPGTPITSSGAGGHLGPVGLAAPSDTYPTEWLNSSPNHNEDR
ncbi:hypothetical protein BH11ACT6_BH11ACT6_03690 [soil metagenome]